jgi:hypothetical protein
MKIITGVIDRIEGETAIIKTQNGIITWPTSELDNKYKEGSSLRLAIVEDVNDSQDRESEAKSLLNQILNNSR